jgi:hypothetical protein
MHPALVEVGLESLFGYFFGNRRLVVEDETLNGELDT